MSSIPVPGLSRLPCPNLEARLPVLNAGGFGRLDFAFQPRGAGFAHCMVLRNGQIVLDDKTGVRTFRSVIGEMEQLSFVLHQDEALEPGVYDLHFLLPGGAGRVGFQVLDSPFNAQGSAQQNTYRLGSSWELIYRGLVDMPTGAEGVDLIPPFPINSITMQVGWTLARNNQTVQGVSLTMTQQLINGWHLACDPPLTEPAELRWIVY